MKRKAFLIVLLLCIPSIITSCINRNKVNQFDGIKPTVVVSIVPQETFVKAVAGDLVNIVTMIPTGSSPESYAPSPKQMQEFSKADAYFCIGISSEQTNILNKVGDINNTIKIVNLADEAAKIYPYREFEPGERDPHVWLSPKRVKVMIDVIEKELSLIDANNSDIYHKNAQDYKDRLEKVDSDIKAVFSKAENDTFIIYHPSLGYFADDYGLTMLSLEEEGKAVTPKEIQEMADFARAKKIDTIFYQVESGNRQAEAFAREINGRAQQVEPLAGDYIENLERMTQALFTALK